MPSAHVHLGGGAGLPPYERPGASYTFYRSIRCPVVTLGAYAAAAAALASFGAYHHDERNHGLEKNSPSLCPCTISVTTTFIMTFAVMGR